MYKKIDFRGKVVGNNDRDKNTGSAFSYLDLPKDVKVFSLDENVSSILLDIVPYIVSDPHHPCREDGSEIATPGTLWWRRPFAIHRGIGANSETIVCPTSIGKRCPICEFQLKMYKEKGPTDETKALRAKKRDLYVVIPIDSPKHDEVPYIMDMARTCFQDTLAEDLKLKPKNELFFTLDEGKTAYVTFKWKSLGETNFPEARAISFEPREPYPDSILDEIPNLDKVLKVKSYDELYAMFYQVDNEIEGGDLHEVKEDEPIRERKSLRERASESSEKIREREPAPDKEEKAPERRSLRRNSGDESPKEPKAEEGRRTSRRNADDDNSEKTPRSRNAEDENAEKSARVGRGLRASERDMAEEKCPHKHRFGVDTANFPECDTCKIYDACDEEFIKRKRAATK
jgi:hypothetical protein